MIDCDRLALDAFVSGLDADRFYVSAEAADDAWRRRGRFNVVLLESGWKVDLILRKERAFSREEFARRQPAEIAGAAVWIASAEDMVVAKLEWAHAGESERQLRTSSGSWRSDPASWICPTSNAGCKSTACRRCGSA